MMINYARCTLYRTRTKPHEYCLMSDSGHIWAVVWVMERDYGVFVTPCGLTGLMFFWDEVIKVDVLPV